jgi:hypothetical protein
MPDPCGLAMSAREQDPLIPTRLGDATAEVLPPSVQSMGVEKHVYDPATSVRGIGSGDTDLIVDFLGKEFADEALGLLQDPEGEIIYQQWYHMPSTRKKDRAKPLERLRRLKRALANPTPEGLLPHYRFPVNDQDR